MRRFSLLLPLVLFAAGCATPVAPSGGPPDTTPPSLVASLPAAGATRVADGTVRLTFSERLAAASAARAVTVTPSGDAPPRVRVDGRDVVVELPALRDSTTYVVTVGTDLADARNVRLTAPLTLAFATGDRLDAGQIAGLVRTPTAGAPAAGLAVWAYAAVDTTARPDPSAVAPDYRSETGADGRFRLGFLRPGLYRVVAVADDNRSGRAELGDSFAVTPSPWVRADTSADATPLALFVARVDTTAPAVRSVRALTNRRLAVRFSEAVVLRADAGGWTAEDSLSGATLPLRPYQTGPTEIAAVAMAPLPADARLRLASRDAVADSSGNALAPFVRSVATAGASPDTLTARVAAWVPAAPADSVRTLAAGAWPGARFTVPPDSSALRLLDAGGATIATRAESDDGVTVRLVPLAAVAEGTVLTLRVGDGAAAPSRRYRIAEASETGGIVGTVPGVEGEAAQIVVEATRVGGREAVTVDAGADGRFAFERLAPGRYRLRLWADRDGDGRWSGGRLAPYVAPEPLVLVAEPVAVRARWETEVEPERLALPVFP